MNINVQTCITYASDFLLEGESLCQYSPPCKYIVCIKNNAFYLYLRRLRDKNKRRRQKKIVKYIIVDRWTDIIHFTGTELQRFDDGQSVHRQ